MPAATTCKSCGAKLVADNSVPGYVRGLGHKTPDEKRPKAFELISDVHKALNAGKAPCNTCGTHYKDLIERELKATVKH